MIFFSLRFLMFVGCPIGCNTCSAYNGCSTCKPRYYFLLHRSGIKQVGLCTHACPVGFYPNSADGYYRCSSKFLVPYNAPPPPRMHEGAACVFPFSRERGYFLALVSERFPEKARKRGCFVIANDNQYPRLWR